LENISQVVLPETEQWQEQNLSWENTQLFRNSARRWCTYWWIKCIVVSLRFLHSSASLSADVVPVF